MKVSIGTKIKNSAWGGGNSFAINLKNFLQRNNIEVFFDLKCKDLDFIILTDPRSNSISSNFDDLDIINYQLRNKKTIVLHRVNECDERKNTNYVNRQLLYANRVADHTIFVSNWLKKILVDFGFKKEKNSIILNGADKNIFKYNPDNWLKGKLKIVTHHWSSHPNKGERVYKILDNLIEKEKWRDKIQFYYIGNVSKNNTYKNVILIKPLAGKELSKFLSSCHIYLTGSINEPGGNHQNEGAATGLPVLYLDSGSMKEYLNGYGVDFNYDNFEEKLFEIINNYKILKLKMRNYPHDSEKTCKEYYDLIISMQKNREKILANKILPKLTILEKLKLLIRKIYI